MLELRGSDVLNSFQMLSTLHQSLQGHKGVLQLAEVSCTEMDEALATLEEHAASLELPLTLKSIKQVRKIWDGAAKTANGRQWQFLEAHDLHGKMGQFTHRIRDEYTTRVFLAVPYGMAKYYSSPQEVFGPKVWAAFPTHGQFEMEEACRCFALARHTAAVFHLMRLMEVAITAVRESLGIPDPIKPAGRNWGAILKSIKESGIDPRNVKGGPGWNDPLDRSLFDELYLLLTAVKDTWRNTTMHVENKYGEEEAETILMSVRTFVRKVAGRMDESGDPKV
jgi:hypothetical protein